jgi:hypothetical protein
LKTAERQQVRCRGEFEPLAGVLEEKPAEEIRIVLGGQLCPDLRVWIQRVKERQDVALEFFALGLWALEEPRSGRGGATGRFANDLLALAMCRRG